MWKELIRIFHPKTLLDVGSAEGHAVKWFIEHGVNAMGIEGLPRNVEKAVAPTILHDLRYNPYYCLDVDMVWCCEVVEHIPRKFIRNLLDTLHLGRVIAMTFSPVGGYHHANVRDESYWVDKIQGIGYRLHPCTDGLRMMAEHVFFRKTGLVFVR